LGGGKSANQLQSNDAPATTMAGQGASQGMPTCDDNGVVKMTYRQVNQDGAGPLTAMIDSTSGGTNPNDFQPAQMVDDVPGAIDVHLPTRALEEKLASSHFARGICFELE